MAAPAGAVCAQHPDASAVATCLRCGSFLCDGCVLIHDEDAYCADCLRTLSSGPASRLARASVGLAATALVFNAAGFGLAPMFGTDAVVVAIGVAFLLALVAAGISLFERARISRFAAPPAGRRWTLAALILCAVPLAEVLLFLVSMGAGYFGGKAAR
jgi:hypothetical protein